MKKALFNKGSSPRNVVGDLPLIKSLIHKESSLFKTAKSAGDCRQRHSAMTTFFNEKAFTLIELLVVVLIIGILSAIALPQYQKAVEKSKATQALVIIRSVADAVHRYHLANGSYPTNLSQLDIDIPWTGNVGWRTHQYAGQKVSSLSNEDWSLQLLYGNEVGSGIDVYIGRISGPYAGGGFGIYMEDSNGLVADTLYCLERKSGGIVLTGKEGRYCHQLWNTSSVANYGNTKNTSYRAYLMP